MAALNQCPKCKRTLFGERQACPACGAVLDNQFEQTQNYLKWTLHALGLFYIGAAGFMLTQSPAQGYSINAHRFGCFIDICLGFCALTGTSLGFLRFILWPRVGWAVFFIYKGNETGETILLALGIVLLVFSGAMLWLVGKVHQV